VNPQKFKEAYLPPYDIAGWTLPYQMGVKVRAANTLLDLPMTLAEKFTAAGRVEAARGRRI